MYLDTEEQEVMDHILAAMEGIQGWGLNCNSAELSHAVHGLQMFVILHALQRESPDAWSSWYDDSD
jgi:hypothetical protein